MRSRTARHTSDGRAHSSVLAFGPGGECVDLVVLLDGREQWPHLREVLPRDTQHRIWCTERAPRGGHAGRTVEGGHLRRKRINVGG